MACDQGDLLVKCFQFDTKEFAAGRPEIIPNSCKVEIENNAACLLQHDRRALVGRHGKSGNVSFEKKDNSLMMRVKKVSTKNFEEAYDLVKSGVIAGASIGFKAVPKILSDGTRTFDALKIREVSLVSDPAYKNTRIEARSSNNNKTIFPPECY